MSDATLTPEIEQHLTAEFHRLKRSVDDLPYTPAFDSIIDGWPEADKPTPHQVWHWLSELRKDAKLGGYKVQPSSLPNNVQHSLATMLSRQSSRESLPYTPEFEQMFEELMRDGLDCAVTRHDIWWATLNFARENRCHRVASHLNCSTI